MTRAVAAVGALLITGVLLLIAFTGVSWFMSSHAVWAVARHFNGTWISVWISCGAAIWISLYVPYAHKKKSSAEKNETFR